LCGLSFWGRMHKRKFSLFFPALVVSLVATVLAYAPGLHGGFLFDDFGNLPALGDSGPIDNWPAFWRYITSGIADPTGRPLALLSFLIDAQNWPADPYPFKRTSLLLHLLNGALLALLLRHLGNSLAPSDCEHRPSLNFRRDIAAVLGAAFWLLHPLFVSTTLYIVQREAMLPATFTLTGLLLWLYGRDLFRQGRVKRGFASVLLGLGGCTVLGVLSKANGALLPAFALLIELVLHQTRDQSTLAIDLRDNADSSMPTYEITMLVLAWLPTAMIMTYLIYQGWEGLAHGISSRPWTLGQRLLTEPRVLIDYLKLLWLPQPFTPGLFNDQFLPSISLWSPISTLPSLLTIAGLIAGAWLSRRKVTALSLAILFFFVGQSLESSTVALELYFEHRNYLPAMLMFWPLALWLCGISLSPSVTPIQTNLPGGIDKVASTAMPHAIKAASPRAWLYTKVTLGTMLMLGLGLMTYAGADLWGNTSDQALLWAKLNPHSPRAQANAAQIEMENIQPDRAALRLQLALENSPNEVQLALNLFAARCQMGQVNQATLDASRTALATSHDPGGMLTSWFERAIEQSAHPACPEASLASLQSLLNAARTNPRLMNEPGRRQDLYYLQGRIALAREEPDDALASFNLAIDQQVREAAALKQASLLGSMGFPEQGLAHIDHYRREQEKETSPGFGMPQIHAFVLARQDYWEHELIHLRDTLRKDVNAKAELKK
jgi:hypothetical protein